MIGGRRHSMDYLIAFGVGIPAFFFFLWCYKKNRQGMRDCRKWFC